MTERDEKVLSHQCNTTPRALACRYSQGLGKHRLFSHMADPTHKNSGHEGASNPDPLLAHPSFGTPTGLGNDERLWKLGKTVYTLRQELR